MDIQKKKRALIEVVWMVALICMLTIVGAYIPALALVIFFVPTPFIVLGKRYGTKLGILSVVAWGLIIVRFFGIYSMFFIVLFGMTSIVIVYMMNKEYKPQQVFGAGAFAALIGLILSIYLGSKIFGVDLIVQISEGFKKSMEMQIDIYQTMGMEQQNLAEFKKSLESVTQLITMAIPAEMVIISSFFAYINYKFAIRILRKTNDKIQGLPLLKDIRLPKNIIMGTFLIMLLTMATRYFKFANYQSLVLNIFLIFQLVYFIQGLAVISYFLNVSRLNRLVRIIIYTLLLFNGSGMVILAIVGFTDALVNLRKLKTEN